MSDCLPATLRFPEAGTIAGEAPCNSYSARMVAPYPWFETGVVTTTERTCADQDQERAFFEALAGATQSEVLDTTLILSGNGIEMIFTTGG